MCLFTYGKNLLPLNYNCWYYSPGDTLDATKKEKPLSADH